MGFRIQRLKDRRQRSGQRSALIGIFKYEIRISKTECFDDQNKHIFMQS